MLKDLIWRIVIHIWYLDVVHGTCTICSHFVYAKRLMVFLHLLLEAWGCRKNHFVFNDLPQKSSPRMWKFFTCFVNVFLL